MKESSKYVKNLYIIIFIKLYKININVIKY